MELHSARAFPFIFLMSVLAFVVLPVPAHAQSIGLVALLDGVAEKLEDMDDMSADFLQIYEDPLNRMEPQRGHLYLRRPRMMRWEYQTPEEYLFVADGDTVYLYDPAAQQVNRESVGDTFDDRMPIMFLLGRSDLENEFTSIGLNPAGIPPMVPGTEVLRMYPRRESDVREVVLDVDPVTFDIRRLRLTYVDDSIMEFVFDKVQTNIGLDRSLFDFVPPPEVEIVEGIGQ